MLLWLTVQIQLLSCSSILFVCRLLQLYNYTIVFVLHAISAFGASKAMRCDSDRYWITSFIYCSLYFK